MRKRPVRMPGALLAICGCMLTTAFGRARPPGRAAAAGASPRRTGTARTRTARTRDRKEPGPQEPGAARTREPQQPGAALAQAKAAGGTVKVTVAGPDRRLADAARAERRRYDGPAFSNPALTRH